MLARISVIWLQSLVIYVGRPSYVLKALQGTQIY